MREKIKKFSQRKPATSNEWKKYFYELAKLAGFTEIIEEPGHGDVFVRSHPIKIDKNLGKLVIGEQFIPEYEDLLRNYPELFKTYLEHTVIHLAGDVFTSGIVYPGMEGLATMVGAEKFGYSKNEILELLAIEVVIGYIRERKDFESYLRKVEPKYNHIFWDHLFKEDVTHIIQRARAIYAELSKISDDTGQSKTERKTRIIDSHIHIGNNRQTKYYSLEELERDLGEADAQGAVLLAFPEDIYRIVDTRESRIKSNQYVLEVSRQRKNLYPFYFVWNDYIIPDNLDEYKGIKWHRHPDEPRYDYDNPKCKEILSLIKELDLPIILEEETEITARFIERNPELKVIIPHMGKLSGGYDKMSIFFDNPNVYFDTSTASLEAISNVLDKVGAERVIFGSDVSGTTQPFYNFPKVELEKLSRLNLDEEARELIFARNIEKLVNTKATKKHKESELKIF